MKFTFDRQKSSKGISHLRDERVRTGYTGQITDHSRTDDSEVQGTRDTRWGMGEIPEVVNKKSVSEEDGSSGRWKHVTSNSYGVPTCITWSERS